uniref:KfrA N-terminal DNA-binding domain-containing protein n=1 Tax=Ralstonia solanacearum TaxID=305 RepID=A0A0S4VS83_RALSL|nr:protein of unknown function [Ralstonia solanacearum]CUV37411.1 protein of unknown function [Ralstonia solanacearum]CUV42618.1 protein of unknown function [Ralstonia solanacearum]CUV57869.1 protein of unknown function [Ralstonia solanacearum]CUV63780.1 protein of unknown function [Ralstonia solanacearum]
MPAWIARCEALPRFAGREGWLSIDAIHVVLGNTGSKTTIHRYLKDLQEELRLIVIRLCGAWLRSR